MKSRSTLLPALGLLAMSALCPPACQRQDADGAAAGAAGAAGPTSPVSERDRQRREALAKALEGLDFEGPAGLVEVEPLGPPDPDTASAHLKTAALHMEQNKHLEAIAACTLAIRAGADGAAAFEALGMALLHKRRSDLAVIALRTAVNRDASSVSARYNLGYALSMAERQDEAAQALEAVVALDPSHGPAHERLAIWSYYAGDDRRAWSHVQSAEAAGHALPPQFMVLLETRTARPAAMTSPG